MKREREGEREREKEPTYLLSMYQVVVSESLKKVFDDHGVDSFLRSSFLKFLKRLTKEKEN